MSDYSDSQAIKIIKNIDSSFTTKRDGDKLKILDIDGKVVGIQGFKDFGDYAFVGGTNSVATGGTKAFEEYRKNYLGTKPKVAGFKAGKGKAYSYFSIVGKNYLILYNNKNYAKKKGKADLIEVDTDNEILNGFERKEVLGVKIEFLDFYVQHVDNNLNKYFKKEDERKVADAVLTIFKNREHLEIFNKKAIYIYIREITGLETPIITKVAKKMRDLFNKAYSNYLNTGYIYKHE